MALLFTILLTSRRIYRTVSLLAACFMGVGSLYILHIASPGVDGAKALAAWLLYAAGVGFMVYYSYLNNVYKGLGRIQELQVAHIINQTVYIVLQLVFLYAGFGIVGLAAANLAVSLVYRLQLGRRIGALAREHAESYAEAKREMRSRFLGTYHAIRHNAKGIGLVLVGNYIQTQGSILLLSAFLSLSTVASYGLTMQLISIVATVSAVPFNTYIPRMSSLRIAGETERLKDVYSLVTVFSYMTFLVGGAAVLLLGREVVGLVRSNTGLLTPMQTLVLLVFSFVLTNHQRSTNYISLGNRQPYVASYVVSSLVSLALSAVLLWRGYGVWGVILVNLLVQSAYNGWKWPAEAMKDTSLTLSATINRAWRQLRGTFMGGSS